MGSLTIGQVATYRPLRKCGLEELAIHQISATPSGGVLFARKTEREQKDIARKMVLDLVSRERHPDNLSVLTMPGLNWSFERKLLGRREKDWQRLVSPLRTQITAIENDRMIYHAALMSMPGMQQAKAVGNSPITVLPATAFSERGVANSWVEYHFGNIDNFMAEPGEMFDVAWLDYTGPLSIERLAIIKKFFAARVRHTLIITHLKARWNVDTSAAISRAGGANAWVKKHIAGRIEHDHEYQDGASPMAQIAITKE